MNFTLSLAKPNETKIAFDLLKSAAETLTKKGINQWQYWKNPPQEKTKWIEEGFLNKEFFFIKNMNNETMGMVRILNSDLLYWNQMNDKAKYVHSLIILEEFAGQKIGSQVLERIKDDAIHEGVKYLRLDCDSSNKMLCAYYEKLDFVKVGEKQLPLGSYNLYQKILAD